MASMHTSFMFMNMALTDEQHVSGACCEATTFHAAKDTRSIAVPVHIFESYLASSVVDANALLRL
jgi:hypothetical protein